MVIWNFESCSQKQLHWIPNLLRYASEHKIIIQIFVETEKKVFHFLGVVLSSKTFQIAFEILYKMSAIITCRFSLKFISAHVVYMKDDMLEILERIFPMEKLWIVKRKTQGKTNLFSKKLFVSSGNPKRYFELCKQNVNRKATQSLTRQLKADLEQQNCFLWEEWTWTDWLIKIRPYSNL